jgi:primosomal protein N' (replication factor Y)
MLEFSKENRFVEVIVPLPLEGCFTYSIPDTIEQIPKPGCRVEIEFGKRRHYSAIVRRTVNSPVVKNIKPIIQVLDQEPIVTENQLEFWDWMSRYYMASIGDVMNTALISAFKLESNTTILRTDKAYDLHELTDYEYLILEALDIKNQLSILDIQSILQRKTILPIIKKLIELDLIVTREELNEQESAVKVKWIRISPTLLVDPIALNKTMTELETSEKKIHHLLSYLNHCKKGEWIKVKVFHQLSKSESSTTASLIKKKIYEQIELDKYDIPELLETQEEHKLSDEQQQAMDEIMTCFKEKSVALLHGITGSGKTEIYTQIIKENLKSGKQILFLVPEISLTTQLVKRLKHFFGDQIIEYHSGIYAKDKIAIWNKAKNNHPIIIGARSAIHLPFSNLGLIIIDEEHDASYKQHESSPYYNSRDAAIYLANLHKAKIILGSATPSIESYHNAITGKFGLITLSNRFGNSVLPEINVIGLKAEEQLGHMKGHFSKPLIEAIQTELAKEKQVLVFRNRRGYSPIVKCNNCNFEALCDRCDIHLTLHKFSNKIKCHICGAQKAMPIVCPECNKATLKILGFGTEQLEEEMNTLFPSAKIKRLDLDAARTRKSQREIIEEFEDGDFDILIGTQMITKGFDFEKVGLVVVIQADQILFYPDFRSHERGYQLLTQVAGRAGRRSEKGNVIIQAYAMNHPILLQVIDQNYIEFFNLEIQDRHIFAYPPFTRLIRLELRHTKPNILAAGCDLLQKRLTGLLDKKYILGPAEPHISRIKGAYIKEFIIKLEKEKIDSAKFKSKLREELLSLKATEGYSSIRLKIDVDPY